MKNVNFVLKDVQRILLSHKISEKYNEQEMFYKKTVIINFATITRKQLCWSLVFIKKRLQLKCFLGNAANFLKTAILKNICERLLLRVFPFMLVEGFPT